MILKFVLSKKFYLPISYIVFGIIFYAVICNIVNKTLKVKNKHINMKKQTTIVNLIKSIIKYIILIIVILMILSVYGVDTSSIIASISVVGVVIGLAFQDTLKNLLSGISIIFDNHYMVGDVVEINGFKGEVISLGLQSTKVKSYTGEVFIIGNSLITSIINYSQNDSKLLIDIPVSYNTNINKLEKILDNLRDRIENISSVRGGYELLGVDSFSSSAVIYKIVVDCICNEQFGVKRKILKLIKEELDKNKIEIPYNKLDVYIK